MSDLTPRQQAVFQFIQDFVREHGLPPTRSEIASAMGYRSVNAAEEHLRALARKGVLEVLAGASRGIRLRGGTGLPVVGRVAAGSPILAQEHIEARYQVDPQLFRPRADYLLRVRGMSMRDAGILDGDLLAVHRTPEAGDGSVVVARLGDEVTVKRLRHGPAGIELHPENPDFPVIHVDRGDPDFTIEGLAVGLIRNTPML